MWENHFNLSIIKYTIPSKFHSSFTKEQNSSFKNVLQSQPSRLDDTTNLKVQGKMETIF
jgi:hypothetical protein